MLDPAVLLVCNSVNNIWHLLDLFYVLVSIKFRRLRSVKLRQNFAFTFWLNFSNKRTFTYTAVWQWPNYSAKKLKLRRVLETLCGAFERRTTFTRSPISPPEVNGFRWNLGHSEYIVWSWPWQILGAIRADARAGALADFLFLSDKQRAISPTSGRPNLTKFAQYVDLCRNESFRNEFFINFPVRGRFFQKGIFLQNDSTTSNFRPP